jgi:iron-sulfur cluster repair protein YtfE (RIC family)
MLETNSPFGRGEKMSALIERFKKEHSEIIATLKEVKRFGVLSKEGQSKLMSAKKSLLEHLKSENTLLYPVLKKEAEHNKELKNVLKLFTMDPEYVSRVVSEFFDKYSGGNIDADFTVNFESLFAAIGARIRNEEEALYQEYETISQQ